MSSSPLGTLLGHLREMGSAHGRMQFTDAELLCGFANRSDEAAFATLVQRHGPMVLRVCRRVLHHDQDAEDAFQATFLVLARSAATIRKRESLASWLHGVACRMAANAKRTEARRRAHEKRAQTALVPDPDKELHWREVQAALDEEVRRLPGKYRAVFVSCCLEGESRADVARQLGEKEGTVSSRLAEARRLLQKRLARRGITLSAVLTAIALTQGTGQGEVPAGLARSTVVAAGTLARGGAGAVTGIPEGVLKLMGRAAFNLQYVKLSAIVLSLFAAALTVGAVALARQSPIVTNLVQSQANTDQAPQASEEKPQRTDKHGDPLPEGAVTRIGTLRFRQGGGKINRLLLTPDGSTLISKSFYGERAVCVWDAATGRLLRQFPGHHEENRAVALSPDGKTLAIGQDNIIHFHDLASGREVRQLKSSLSETSGLAFSPDGKMLASGHAGTAVLLWDLATGKVQTQLKTRLNRSLLLEFSPDGKRLATGDTLDQLIQLFDVATGMERLQILRPNHVHEFAFSPDSTTLAAGARDGGVTLWDVATGKLIREMTSPNKYVRSVAWSPDGKTLAAGEYNIEKQKFCIRLWDPSTGKERLHTQTGEAWGVPGCLVFAPDGKTLFCGGFDSVIRLWDTATGIEKSPVAGLPSVVWHLAISPNGKTLAYTTTQGISLWDRAAERVVGTLPGHHWSFAFSPDGKTLAGGSDENVFNVWDVANQRLLRKVEIDIKKEQLRWVAFYHVAFSPDGKMLATGNDEYDGSDRKSIIRLWDPMTGQELQRHNMRESAKGMFTVESVAFSADSKMLAASGRTGRLDGIIRMWDTAGGNEQTSIQSALNSSLGEFKQPERFDKEGIVQPRIVYSPNGRLLAMNRARAAIPVWEAVTGRERCQLVGHDGATSCVAFSADGLTLASAGWDNTIRIWDVETAKELKRLTGHRGKANTLAFTPDGRMLISGGDDTTVLFWDVAEFTQRSRPVERLTPAEWNTLWADLGGADAGKAHRALARLSAAPAVTVSSLRERLKPAQVPDAARLAQLVRDLDAEEFTVREKASKELERMGDEAAPALEAAQANASPESRRRCDELLKKLIVPSGELLRELRALEVLERIGTPEAHTVLEAVAKGDPKARLTREAKATLNRVLMPSGKN